MWGRVVNYKECQEKCRSAIKRWQIAEAKTAYSSLADRNYPTRALTARAVPKEQSGGDGSVQRELCVFVPDACNTFPLPTAILPVRRWLKIRVVTARRLLLPPRSRAYGVLAPVGCCQLKSITQFGGPARQALDQPLAISYFVGFDTSG